MPAEPAGRERLTIEGLGAAGDGLARWADDSPAYVPDTLPGEIVLARRAARRGGGYAATLLEVLQPRAHRRVPPCPHFGTCGGCALQHADDATYAAFKRDLLTQALRRAGVELEPAALLGTPPQARRRLDLALRRRGQFVVVGLHARGGAEVVDLTSCPVAHPALEALIPPLREVLPRLDGLRREGSAVVNLLEAGPDLLLRTDAELSAADRSKLAAFARAAGVPRISWASLQGSPEAVAVLAQTTVRFSGTEVVVPPGAFLQASAEGEEAIVRTVLEALPEKLPGKARIVELFAGVGTLSFALATRARVQAYEGDDASVRALRRAAGGTRIEVVHRDLARQPLQVAELRGAACVVLDPPYAGAAAQMAPLAASGVKAIVYVSCNPAVLTRDLRVLLAAGYRVERATPIDQFLWTAQLESVISLRR
jgi:23S rRNA (uracil1939-C5)-methyltransferase